MFSRNYLIGSFAAHIFIIIIMALASSHSRVIRKKFIVFGAHSRRNTHVTFKSFNYRKNNQKHTTKVASRSEKKTIKKEKKPVVKKEVKEVKKKIKKTKKKEIKKTESKLQKKTQVAKKKTKKQTKPKKQKNTIKDVIKKKKTIKKVTHKEAKEEIKNQKEPAKKVDQQEKEVEKFHIDLSGQVNKEMLVYQKRIQQEVQRLWRPPLGVPKGTVCTLLLEVGSDGKVIAAELVDRSRVLIYDLSVMKVAKKFAFHKTLWGKQFKIDFRQ